MNEISLEAMKTELEANGYKFQSFRAFAPDGWNYVPEISDESLGIEVLKNELKAKRVERAWQHYQEQQELKALRAFVADVAAIHTGDFFLKASALDRHSEKARQLLAQYGERE